MTFGRSSRGWRSSGGDRLRPGQEAPDLGPLERVQGRVIDDADWTRGGRAPLPVEQVLGRPRVVAGGGQVLGTSALLLGMSWQVHTPGSGSTRSVMRPFVRWCWLGSSPTLNTIYRCLPHLTAVFAALAPGSLPH